MYWVSYSINSKNINPFYDILTEKFNIQIKIYNIREINYFIFVYVSPSLTLDFKMTTLTSVLNYTYIFYNIQTNFRNSKYI